MMKDNVLKFIEKALGIISYFLLTAFMTLFAILSILALVLTFVEKDPFNLVGVAGCAFIAWVMWSLKSEMV